MYIISTELGNNLTSECLIDPSIPEELRVFYFREVSTWHIEWETRRCRGKMDKTKTWWKTEREKKASHQMADSEIASCQLGLLYFTSHYILEMAVCQPLWLELQWRQACFCYLQSEWDTGTCSPLQFTQTQMQRCFEWISHIRSNCTENILLFLYSETDTIIRL